MLTVEAKRFSEIGRAFKNWAATVSFDESEARRSLGDISDPEVLAEIKDILEIRYKDGITSLDRAYMDGESIKGQFSDRLNLRVVKRYKFQITEGDIAYKMLNSAEMSEFNEVEFAATKTKKAPNCKPGNTRCGGRCIKGDAVCRPKNDAATTEKVKAVKEKVGKTKTVAPKEPNPVKEKTAKAKVATPKKANPSEVKPSDATKKEPSSVPLNQKQLDRRRNILVKKYGEELVSKAEASLENALKETSLYIRVRDNDILGKITDSGRFKTVFETKTGHTAASNGLKEALNSRKKSEKAMFGQDKVENDQRAIYGYVARDKTMDGEDYEKSEARGIGFYGNVAVKLKSNKKEEATFTGGDSLSRVVPPTGLQPSGITKPNIASLFQNRDITLDGSGDKIRKMLEGVANAKDLGEITRVTGKREYVETQIHNQVKTTDFEELIYMNGDKPDAKIKSWAKENGVKITIKR